MPPDVSYRECPRTTGQSGLRKRILLSYKCNVGQEDERRPQTTSSPRAGVRIIRHLRMPLIAEGSCSGRFLAATCSADSLDLMR
jgi:hypothetical protein